MAIIKRTPRPGQLIRGAKTGPAALDKDGNVITLKSTSANAGKVLTVNSDGSVSFKDVPSELPGGAQSGDVLTNVSGDLGWRPPYPDYSQSDEGKVLTATENGVKWATAGGGTAKYLHMLSAYVAGGNQTLTFYFMIISNTSESFTSDSLLTFLLSNVLINNGDKWPTWGSVNDSSTSPNVFYMANRLQNVQGSIRVCITISTGNEQNITISSFNGLIDRVFTI